LLQYVVCNVLASSGKIRFAFIYCMDVKLTNSDDWIGLSARIRGLLQASHLAAEILTKNSDALPGMIELGKHASAVLNDLVTFGASLDASAERASRAIEKLKETAGPLFFDSGDRTQETRLIHIRSGLVMIAAAEAEIGYLLRDRQSAIRSRSERAFEHLQRLIVVDASVRHQWAQAFEIGEIECEKLGAVHLLGHGIWAFKVNATGGRTDLVYQEPLTDIGSVKRSADGLVLTEWKKLKRRENPISCYEGAREQASHYATGILAGTELTQYRYAIVVSTNEVEIPEDFEAGGVVYRHINICISPRMPSKR
jgi:hypothetical protein